MKIISKSGKRVDGKESSVAIKKKLKEEDPIIVNAEKGDIEELSPMDPPDGYDKERSINTEYKDLHANLQDLCDEHKTALDECDKFEKALHEFKESGFFITKETNDAFNSFFLAFDNDILPHNRKEERGLFPILQKRMLESGEHSTGDDPHTPIDLMEDEHVKMIQLATLSFNFLGLAMRLKDHEAIATTFDIAYNNGKELVEMLKLHIYKEDHTIFPLAQELLTEKELKEFYD